MPGVCDVCGSTEFKRRPDDKEQTVRSEWKNIAPKTAPILPYYEAKGLVRRVDGMAPDRRGGGADRHNSGRHGLAEGILLIRRAPNEDHPCPDASRGSLAPAAAEDRFGGSNGFEVRETVPLVVPPGAAFDSFRQLLGTGGILSTPTAGILPTSISSSFLAAAFASVFQRRRRNRASARRLCRTGQAGHPDRRSWPLALRSDRPGSWISSSRRIAGGSLITLDYKVAGFANGGAAKLAPAVDDVLADQMKRFRSYATSRPKA